MLLLHSCWQDFVVHVTEEFLEFISDGALAIEVDEVSREIELWVSIQELNEQGEYSSVELHPSKDVSTGGVFQLRQVRLSACVM
ncbi:kinesin KIF13A [Labeo rohita]|uniref:Kinesin KIF13A n=1 Tax=Labeo rohita TaxID=84645 RepID=A0A498NYA3_LABRO|nr:kinesin KIF13A [Labeo rohita]